MLLGILVYGHGHGLNAAVVTITKVWKIYDILGVLTRWPGFLLRDCRQLFVDPSFLSWMPVRSRHYCEEPGKVLVWIVTAQRLQML